jgi:hypothetical protein
MDQKGDRLELQRRLEQTRRLGALLPITTLPTSACKSWR